MVVLACAALLPLLESAVLLVTLARLLTVPVEPVVATTATTDVAPFASVPRLQVIVPDALLQPGFGVAETKVTPAGRTSVSDTPVAWAGPLLRTVNVYVICWPAATGSGLSTLLTSWMSACGGA